MIKNFDQALSYLFSHIPQTSSTEFPGQQGVIRARKLMQLLGNPQERLKVVHVAGTSGKGSTAFLISKLLQASGCSVGLHLSPHILDIRERCQINNQLITQDKFIAYLNAVIPAVEQIVRDTELGTPTYFEILVALAFVAFDNEKLEYAVIETGLGGMFDGTNVVENLQKLCVITQIGLDHTKILGETIDKIAAQKAGIIHHGNKVISVYQEPLAREQIEQAVTQHNAKLIYVQRDHHYLDTRVASSGTSFHFIYKDINREVMVGLLGYHQAQNCALALTALIELSDQYNFSLDWKAVNETLTTARFPGRMDVLRVKDKTVIIDGAHNPQKIESFLSSVRSIFDDEQKTFLLAFKSGKDTQHMLEQIVQQADYIIFSSFHLEGQDMPHFSQDPAELKQITDMLEFYQTAVVASAEEGLKTALSRPENVIVITGSLYFVSIIYQILRSS